MSLDLLIQQFDVAIRTPADVGRLKQLILQLAVRGRLVAQEAGDEPAEVLLQKIAAAHAADSKPNSEEIDLPPLPEQWRWSRLPEIAFLNPRNYLDDDTVVSFVPMDVVPTEYGDALRNETRLWRDIRKGYTHLQEGNVAFAKITPCFQNRKSAVMRGLTGGFGAGTTELVVFRSDPRFIVPEYLLIFFKSPGFVQGGIDNMKGTAGQQRVPKEYYVSVPFPLPPTAEQHRIVAQVDALLAAADELAGQLTAAATHRRRFHSATLTALTTAPTPAARAAAWQLLAAPAAAATRPSPPAPPFDRLYTDPTAVAELKAAVLQLAVMGRLVPQDPDDEPAGVLLGRIREEKEELAKKGEIRKPKEPAPISADDTPYSLPQYWEWARVSQATTHIVDCPHSTPTFVQTGNYYCIDTTNINQGVVLYDRLRRVSKETFEARIQRLKPKAGDILFSREGSIGLSVTVPQGLEVCLGQRMMLFRTHNLVVPEYFRLALTSFMFVSQWGASLKGTAARHVNVGALSEMLVPVPPTAEQHRIVARVDELFALADEAAGRGAAAEAARGRFLTAITN